MAYVSRNVATSFRHFEPDQRRFGFGDDLVGFVLPRAPEVRHHDNLVEETSLLKTRSSDVPSTDESHQNKWTTESFHQSLTEVTRVVNAIPNELLQVDKRVTRKRWGISRREQCRLNQARYRKRQRRSQAELEQSVKRLRKEVGHLKRGYENVRLDGKPKRSPWAIVAEVFRLVESSLSLRRKVDVVDTTNDVNLQMFLQECFSPDVKMGNFSGVDALMDQLHHYTQSFGDPKLQLQRIESMAPGVMIVTGRLQATVTDLSLRNVFPNLATEARLFHNRLLGQRMNCSCTTTFLFDEDNGRVERLEVSIDVLDPLLHVFGKLESVATTLTNYKQFVNDSE